MSSYFGHHNYLPVTILTRIPCSPDCENIYPEPREYLHDLQISMTMSDNERLWATMNDYEPVVLI